MKTIGEKSLSSAQINDKDDKSDIQENFESNYLSRRQI